MKKAKKTIETPVEKTALGRVIPEFRKPPATLPPTARSLKPNLWLSTACADNPTDETLAIRDAWAFRFPVTQAAEFVEHDSQVIFGPDMRTSLGKVVNNG